MLVWSGEVGGSAEVGVRKPEGRDQGQRGGGEGRDRQGDAVGRPQRMRQVQAPRGGNGQDHLPPPRPHRKDGQNGKLHRGLSSYSLPRPKGEEYFISISIFLDKHTRLFPPN